MNVDAIIAEAAQEAAIEQPAAQAAPSDIQEQSAETTQEPEKEDLSKKSDDELTPEQLAKRIKNRESHQNSKLAEMRRQLKEAKAESERLKQQVSQAKPQSAPPEVKSGKPVKPQLEQFETFEQYEQAKDDYFEALADWKTEQKFTEQSKQTQEAQVTQQYMEWVDQRSTLVDNRVTELASVIPDFQQTIEEIEDIIPALTPELARVALEADDINLAAYTLFKEGKLADVMRLPPSMAAREIAKAEIRGAAFLNKPKPISNAPAPISPSRGNAIGSKSIEKMDGVELLKSIRST